MALPRFTVTGNLAEIYGASTAGFFDLTYPTSLRVVFRTNFEPTTALITYEDNLFKVETIYAAVDENGDLRHGTMVANDIVADYDPVLLVARTGLGVPNFQHQFSLEKKTGTVWSSLTSWWFDAALDGTTVDLSDVVPVPPTNRFRGPPANIVSGLFDGNDDLILYNVDGSYTTPIELPSGSITFIDNGDGTVQVG